MLNKFPLKKGLFTVLTTTALIGMPSALANTYYYQVQVKTTDIKGAGTNADVFITLYGTKGVLEKAQLDNPGYNDFEAGDDDPYTLSTTQDLGKIYSIKLEHDNSGPGSGWHVDHIDILFGGTTPVSAQIGKTLASKLFKIERWLATDEEDQKTYVTVGSITRKWEKEPTEFQPVNVGLHHVEVVSASSPSTFKVTQTVVDSLVLTNTSSTVKSKSASLDTTASVSGNYGPVAASLEVSVGLATALVEETTNAVSRAKSYTTTIEGTRNFTAQPGEVLCIEYLQYESQANGKLTLEDQTFEFTKVGHSWIQPKVSKYREGSPEHLNFVKKHSAYML